MGLCLYMSPYFHLKKRSLKFQLFTLKKKNNFGVQEDKCKMWSLGLLWPVYKYPPNVQSGFLPQIVQLFFPNVYNKRLMKGHF